MEKESAEPEEAEEEVPEGDTDRPDEKPEETPEAVKDEEEKKAKLSKPEPKKKKDVTSKGIATQLTPTKSKLKRTIEIMKTGKFIIKDDKFKKLKKHPSLGIWDPFLEDQYTKSEIKLFEIKKRKLFKKPKGAQQKQFKTSKPLVKTFKHLVDERRGGKKVKKTKLTKLQKQKLKLKNKLLAKPKKAGCSKFLASRRICRLLKKLKFIRLSTEKKSKPKIKKKPKIIKIKKVKKSKIPKKTGELDPKKISEQKSALKSKTPKHSKESKKKAKDKDKEKGKERIKTKKRHKLKDAKRAERKRKKKHDKEKQENQEKKSKKKKDIKEDKEKSKATKQKTVKITKENKEFQSKPIPKPKEDKKPKPLKTKLAEKSKTTKAETKKVQKKTKKVKIKKTVLCKFKKRYEYREIIYIDFKSPEITTDEDSMKTRTTSTIPRTTSEQYLKFRKKNENLEKIKQKLIDELIHSLKSEKLEFVEMIKYEPVLKLFLNKKHLLSKFEIIEILNRNLNILNHKIDRIKKYSKNFIKNASKYKEYNDNLLFREIKRIYSDYVDVLEILKFKFDIEPEEILKTPLENLIKLQNYQPEFLFKRVRFKYLKNIKKALKERNKELKLLNRKNDYVVSDAMLEEIFNSYVPLNLVFDDIPTFMVNDVDYQLEVTRLKNLLFFNYCNYMDQEWDVTLDILNMESDVVALTKYHKRDIILEKYKRLQLEKPKRPPQLPVDVMLKRIKMRKAIRRIDTNYNWDRRIFDLNMNSFVIPPVDCKYFTIYERPNRSLYKDALNEKIILVRDEFKKHDVFLDPIKQLTEYKHIFEKMDIDWANYPKEKQQKRQLKFSVADYLYRTIYPEGFPRRKLDYFVFLNRILEDDINRNAYKNVFDLTYQETDESSSEPRIIKKSGDTKEVQQAPVIYEEEEIGEGEEMEEERSDDVADPIKMYEKPVKTYSESDFEGSESTDRSSFVFDYIENEYNRMMNAFRKLKFDNNIQPEFPPKVQNSTQIHIEFDNVNKNVCELVCQYNIKKFYSECVKKKLVEEEEARRKKYLYYIVLETPITWEIPQPPQSLLNARIKFSKAKFLKRVCNYNRDIPVLLEYFKDIFSTKTLPGVMRTFNYLWNFGVKGSFGYKVALIKWYPSRNDLLFVLFSKKRQINYGRSIQDKIGHMFVIELQYWHKPARFIKFPAAPVILEFNPQRLNYMAIVLKTCEVQIYNLALSNYNKYKPVLTCANILFRLKIVNLHWISDSKINESNYMFFFTFSRCGYVDKWQIHRTYLSVIPHIRVDEAMGPTFDFTTVQMGVDISCVAFHPNFRTIFLLGTCTGLLYRCTTEHVNNTFIRIVAYDDNLKSIQFNILVPKIFLTYGDFRLIKIWDYKMLSCIYEINTEDYITCIAWAPFSSTVFVVAQTKALFVYDLNLNENNEIAKQNIYDKDSNVTTITAFAFHHAYDYVITVGCNNGELCLVKLAPQIRGHILRFELGEVQPNTMDNQLKKVQFMLDSHRDYHDSLSESDTTDSENFGVLVPTEGEEKDGDEGEGGGEQQAAAIESDED